MAMRFSQYKAVSVKGTARERAIVSGALEMLKESFCRAETALSFLEGISAKLNHARIVVKCTGDYTCVFDSSAQTNEPNEWADDFLSKPFLVRCEETIVEYDYDGNYCGEYTRSSVKGFADELSARLYAAESSDRKFVNPIKGLTTTKKRVANYARELRRLGMPYSDAMFVASYFIKGSFLWDDAKIRRFNNLLTSELVEFEDGGNYTKYFYNGVLVG